MNPTIPPPPLTNNIMAPTSSFKGPSPQHYDGSGLRVAIVHARWNATIIEPLVAGTRAKLLECGVDERNIVVQSCPGSWELPITVQRCVISVFMSMYAPPGANWPASFPHPRSRH